MFKDLFMQVMGLAKVAGIENAKKFQPVALTMLGFALMIVATPYAAMHVPQGSPMTFIGGLLVVALFFMGAYFINDGVDKFKNIPAKDLQLGKQFKTASAAMFELFKKNTVNAFDKAKPLAVAIFGYALMLGATPYAAVHVPQGSPMTLIGGALVVALFLMGAYLIKQGLEQFEALIASAKSVQLAKPAV